MSDWHWHTAGHVTPWQPAGTAPAAPGIYEREYAQQGRSMVSGGRRAVFAFARFDGSKWSKPSRTINDATVLPCKHQDARPWRGLNAQVAA